LKPQQAIKEILDASPDSTIVNDAGTHTTWVTLYKKVLRPFSLLFSGAFGPMGYGLPAAIGASFARPHESIVAIIGDGGFQMTLQELGTAHQNDIPLVICIINNHSLGIIRQWQEMYHSGTYEVELENPDFVKLTQAYGIDAVRVDSPGMVFNAVKKGIELKKPFLIDITVKKEDIPLPDLKIKNKSIRR
jgi:acetolactate synthase-1/2/3 large subunit